MTPTADSMSMSIPEAEGRPPRVLVVDDDERARHSHEKILFTFGYETELAGDGIEALAKLSLDIDLVMLDAEMPHMDGYDVARRIREQEEHFDLPIIMVTGLATKEARLRALEVGINDFINKPFDTSELKLRSSWLLKLKRTNDALRRSEAELGRTVERRTSALRKALEEMTEAKRHTYDAHLDTIRRLATAAEYKDANTGAHILRIGLYSEVVARALHLAPGQVELIRYAAPMHDVGKIGVPDAILLKPGPLTTEEREVMQRHAEIGARILEDSPSGLLRLGATIAASHHERVDGAGYPAGLSGEEIPIEGRICAVVDVFDALTMHRPYREALPVETVTGMMEEERGEHFDAKILDVFFNEMEAIEAIRVVHHSDHDERG